jgi:CheY-like chemotaxis protein
MPPRILVVDDEPIARTLIARVLTEEGYQVVAVANGLAAIVAGRTAEVGFDLVVTNTWLATMSASECVSRLQYDFPLVPILHIDDLPSDNESSDTLAAPLAGFKPFSVEALKSAVRQLLKT